MRCLSIFVVVVAAFAGVFVYKVYLPLSPKIVPEDSLVLPIVFAAFNSISSLGEELGISPRYKTLRYLTEFPETLGFNPDNTDEVETIEDTTIGGVPVRIYRPRNSPGQQQERPGLIYFHGGGLVILTATSMLYSKICSRFANVTQAVVISVEYRRAPEHPFPAQFEDCHAVVMKVLEDSSKFGIINGKIAIAGDSAGGLLAAAISVELAKEKREKAIAAQVLINPWLQAIDVTCLTSYQEHSKGFLLRKVDALYYFSLAATGKPDMEKEYFSSNVSRHFMNTKYWKFLEIPENSQCKNLLGQTTAKLPTQFLETVVDSRFSPLLAESLERLPPTFVTIAEFDILASEGSLFARRLEKAGVPVVEKIYKSYHGFLANICLPSTTTPMAMEAMEDMTNFLNSVFYKN